MVNQNTFTQVQADSSTCPLEVHKLITQSNRDNFPTKNQSCNSSNNSNSRDLLFYCRLSQPSLFSTCYRKYFHQRKDPPLTTKTIAYILPCNLLESDYNPWWLLSEIPDYCPIHTYWLPLIKVQK